MRYLFISILFFCTGAGLNAQTLDKLDKANGFKEFKFGKAKNTWKDELKPVKNGAYRYTGKDALAAFGSSIHRVYLRFDKDDKLCGVYVSVQGLIGKGGVKNYKRIISLAYGKEDKEEDKDGELNYYWFAPKTKLVLYSWQNGSTWDAELHFTTPEQYNIDSTMAVQSSVNKP